MLVNYTGRLTDGTIFDSSIDKEALKVNIGVGQVIKGWDIGIMSMKMGEKAELTIKSDYAYGEMGSPPKIKGGATLIFEVELIGIADRRPTRWMMSDPELIRVVPTIKRPFQGWRYLKSEDAPMDLPKGREEEEALPESLSAALAEIGIF